MPVKPIPEGFQQVIPYLVVKDAAAQMDFLIKAFDGDELERMSGPGGTVMHGEVRVGNCVVMLGQAQDDPSIRNTMIYLYVKDCDAVFQKALEAGGTKVSDPADQFYGDRHGAVEDPNGNHWYIATRKEDLTSEELQKRSAKMMKGEWN